MSDGVPDGNGTPFEQPEDVRRALSAVAKARVTEALLVIVVCLASLGLIATTAWNTYRLQSFSQQQVRAQDFGLRAVDCILDNFAEHRWVNETYHREQAEKLGIPVPMHLPLPRRPSEKQLADDCRDFDEGRLGEIPTTTTR